MLVMILPQHSVHLARTTLAAASLALMLNLVRLIFSNYLLGFYVSGTGASTQSACSSGQFSGQGQSSCTNVPAGYQSTKGQYPTVCPDGWYSTGGTDTCHICPAGSICTKIAVSTVSSPLYFTSQGDTFQSLVAAGYQKNDQDPYLPIKCALGGTYWRSSDATCQVCPAGYACPGFDVMEYIPCAPGYYQTLSGMSICNACPAGYYCPSTISNPTECAPGTFSFAYSSASSQCFSCPAGYSCPSTASLPVLCDRGTYSTAGATSCTVMGYGSPASGYYSTTIAGASVVSASSVCTAGQYYVYNTDNFLDTSSMATGCQPCPPGFKCPNGYSVPIACPSGYYSNSAPNPGATDCTICPAGSACPYANQQPVSCPNPSSDDNSVTGFSSGTGQTGCQQIARTCASGYYAFPNPNAFCQQCPEGFSCPSAYQPPIICPTGYYSNAGAVSCTLCEAGNECPSPYGSLKVACAAGTYSAAGSVNCYPVPSHMSVASVSSRPTWCTWGQYNPLATTTTCTNCPLGSWCPGDNVTPITCPNAVELTSTSAYTSAVGELNCFPKLATRGITPLSGTFGTGVGGTGSGFDTYVALGSYGQTGGAKTYDCPKGKQCLFPQENLFTPCPPGTYDMDNKLSCQPCPEGKVCPIRQGVWIASGNSMQDGFFSPLGTHEAMQIPAGWYTDSSNSYMIRPCAAGTYSGDRYTGHSGCITCPIDYVCPFGSNNPIRCNEGHEAPQTGSRECTPCSDSQYVSPTTFRCTTKTTNTFAMHPIFNVEKCRWNNVADTTSMANSALVDCYNMDGQYYTKSSDSYSACPDGYYCLSTGGATFYQKLPCPPGTFSNGLTSATTLQAQCTRCPQGYYCPGAAEGKIICPAGYLCPEGTQFATQYPCPLNTMNPNTGKYLASDCVGCTSGMLCTEGNSSPFNCPPGQNCAGASWSSGICQSGTYSSGGTCLPCPAGQYCVTGASYGLNCPSGTYTSSTGSKSISDCLQSPLNQPIPKYGQTAVPTDYATVAGYVYPTGTAFLYQLPCPAGQICDSSSQATTWTACPIGYACPLGSSTTTYQRCERGYLCKAGSMDSRQAGASTLGNYINALNVEVQCPAGYYCPKGTTRPKRCPLGYYCPAGTEDYRLYPCPNGKYGETVGLTASSGCSTCPGGFYCQQQLKKPVVCPLGTYSSGGADSAYATTGLGFSTPCTQCDAGKYCPYVGLSAPINCGIGWFSPAGSTVCFRCYAGHLCDSTTTSQTYMEANTCSGSQCITYAASSQINDCPSGYYCDGAQFQPIPCPVGTYQIVGDQTTKATTCINVPAGYYNDEQGQNLAQIQVKLCSPGYYCEAGAISKFHKPCAAGTYTSTSGQSSCITCPAGYYCLGATVYPIPCTAGYYCAVGTTIPTPCPIGYYGASTKLTSQIQCTLCTKGHFCAEPGIQAPTAPCNAGYYCPDGEGASTPQPYVCPAGGYCEKGSWAMKKCPAGYYNSATGKKSFTDCALCTPGSYCDGVTTTTSVTGSCQAGYYCVSGSRVIDQYPARPGYYSLAGAGADTQCPLATYNPFYGQSSCTACKIGFYCDSLGMSAPNICPVGYHCPVGSQTPIPCPVGTYNPVTGGTSVLTGTDSLGFPIYDTSIYCLKCPPGKYCATTGLTAPTGNCAAGFYCLESSPVANPSARDVAWGRWDKCPFGSYCPEGTATPYPCPRGTYGASQGLTTAAGCTTCDAGYYCETRNLTAVTGPCDAGFYCPAGEYRPRQYQYRCKAGSYCVAGSTGMTACPGGFYQHLDYQSSCNTCPPGYYCPSGSTAPIACPVGYMCTQQSSATTPCPIGQYNPDLYATACIPCPAGSYCGTQALSAPTGLCDAGYYCTSTAKISAPNSASEGGGKCGPGYYSPEGSGFCRLCPPGKACPNSAMTDTDVTSTDYNCAAGYYCFLGAVTTTPTEESSQGGSLCPPGYYCPLATFAPYPCPAGTYRAAKSGIALADCTTCPAGSYCEHYGSTTFSVCDEGWYCDAGEVSRTPWDSVNNIAKICPAGYKCTSGFKTECSGNYQDQQGQTSCKTCPAGYMCTTTVMTECGQGNYCPAGQMTPSKCANGFYNLKTTSISSNECVKCPIGYVCSCTTTTVGSYTYCTGSMSIVKCTEGYYCPAGTYSISSSPAVQCPVGYYCPLGAFAKMPCPPGYVCDQLGTTDTTYTTTVCPAGSYCSSATSVIPTDNCPAGYFCPEGSGFAIPCEIGYYNPDSGKSDSTACVLCPTGKYCSSRGTSQPQGALFSCESGYFCPDFATKEPCPAGYYCPQNSVNPIECALGYYTADEAQASCSKCPKGYYCGDDVIENWLSVTAANVIPSKATLCPPGSYCQKLSVMASISQIAGQQCPIGTYNPDNGAAQVGDCIDCPEGYQCLDKGMAEPVSSLPTCDEGYYCPSATVSKNKIVCPVGAYCPALSATYTNCPVGTYNDNTQSTSSSACLACPVNYYCPLRGITSASKQFCGDGFQCTGGAMSAYPDTTQGGDFCDVGNYCSRQSLGLQQCAVGTYQPNKGQASCISCPAGQLCDEVLMTAPVSCPAGSYCPAQTPSIVNQANDCPAGTYSDIPNIGDDSQCVPCPPGKFCLAGADSLTDTAVVKDCDASYFCPIGAKVGTGYTDTYAFGDTDSGLCPAGYYCPEGTLAPVPCPLGQWQPNNGSTECQPCTAGYYCDEQGMSAMDPNKLCDAGHYCLASSTIPNPNITYAADGTTLLGDVCSAGYECPQGSAAQSPCEGGYYEPRNASAACQLCPAGYYCPQSVTDAGVKIGAVTAIECLNGYCPAGSAAPTLCPDGFYGTADLKRLETADDCPYCPNGKYCQNGVIVADCDAGYFCDFGATAYRDEDKICPTGHYCPGGTLLPVRCPQTLYYGGTGARTVAYCKPCAAGYYCLDNDSVSRVCPRGHFCPEKTKEPIPCWIGTYNPYKRAANSTNCLPCPAGANCFERGIDDWTRHLCPIGHYCPTVGSTQPPVICPVGTYNDELGGAKITNCTVCPAGYFCKEGAVAPTPCDAGYFCPNGSSVQTACKPGTYCPAMSGAQIQCPAGYFCPNYRTDIYTKCSNGTYCGPGQSSETQCPNGWFGTSETFNFVQNTSCSTCGPGQYSDQTSKTCQPCEAGYVCFGSASTSRPTSPAQGGQICDAGFYCLKGSYSGIACPVGTYSNTKGNGQLNQCKPCPVNTFGNDVGQTSCQPCQGSTVSDIGSTTCKCIGLNRNYLAQTGKCVCLSGFEPIDGSDASTDGISDCQKLVYQICAADEERDVTGKCRKKDDCAKECNGGPGTIQQNFGICQCNNIVTADQICNADCRQNALQTTFTSQGTIKVYDPKTKNTTETPLPNTLGQAKCSKEDATQCELVGVGMAQSSSGSFQGNYDLPPAITNASKQAAALNTAAKLRRTTNQFKGTPVYANNNGQNSSVQWQQVGRSLQETATSTQSQYISNPVVCTTKGSAILWSDLSETIYPIYQKDNLLNTKSDFDFGAFTALPTQLKGKTGQNFVFTFTDPGVFVFTDSRNPAKLMVVSVVADNHKCPADSKFSPLTYASLLKVGAFQQEVLTPPNWAFFFITLCCFVGLIVVAVLLVSFIARRDWKMKKSPTILYQVSNYKQVERDDPNDVRSIVSINTDSSSFMFRAQGHDDGKDMGEKLEDRMKNKKGAKTDKHGKARTDLSLNQVENLKDALHKHLKEIKKLRALRYGKDGAQVDDELGDDASDYSSSDEDELNNAIDNVKKLISNARAVLRGEGDEAIQIFTEDTKMIEAINTTADKRAEREEAIKIRKEQILENQRVQDEKFKRKINIENETAVNNLEDLKNKVLEMQVNSAYDRGKAFQERMSRAGAKESELTDMMTQLESKMERVEELLLDDKDRQNEMLKRSLEQRRIRRRKLNEKLVDMEEQLQKNDYVQADQKNVIVQELQDELKQEIVKLEEEDVIARENLNKKFDQVKVERLADYQDRLRNAGGSKDFQNILEQFQLAQLQVDKELKRQIEKENDKLDRDLKARKAQAKAAAEIRRNQKFKELEIEQSSKLTNQLDGKAKIVEALTTTDRKDEIMSAFTNCLKQDLNTGNQLVSEMERKRREEEALRQEHERKQRNIQAEAMKEATVLNKDVDDEIARLANQNTYEPFQALVNERSILQRQIQIAGTDQERDLLMRQLREVDDQVKNQLGAEAKDQDMALRRRLDARRQKREAAIERERILKQSLIQERIKNALDNSTNFAVYKNDLTAEAFERIIGQMKFELTPEEIPSAIENLIDDKHQKELSDWLLKLYEQKAIELKEEILTMMEEKIAKQQVLKKNFEDRKRGIDAIISRTENSASKIELQNRKDKLESEMLKEVNRLESEFISAEQRKTREIQARCMDRETKALFEMSEMHFAEKKKIYEQYLPDSLMKDLFEELGKREKEDMDRYQKELEAIKLAKLKSMEEDDRQIQAELESLQKNLNNLTAQEAEVARREMLEARRKKQAERTKQAVVSSQDVITKIREDMEKGLEGLSGAWEEEHKRQLAMMEARLQGRDKKVQQALEQKKLQELRKAEQAELEKSRENEKVRECRRRKAQLLETIISGQQVIVEGCYSRPLWHYNARMHELTVKNDEISNLLNSQSNELKKQVMSSLLQKVSNLEEKVSTDVNKPAGQRSNMTSINKLKSKRSGVNDDVTSQGSNDRISNAKAILGNILKKKF